MIHFSIPVSSIVSLKVYDLLGREVSIVEQNQMKAGAYTYTWNAGLFSSGIYFYRLTASTVNKAKRQLYTHVKKMLYLK